MKTVNHTGLQRLVKVAHSTKVPYYIWGPPGIGKSQVVKEAAKDIAKESKLEFSDDWNDIDDEKKFVFIDLRASQLDPSDIRGLPQIEGDKTRSIYPNWIPRKGRGLILADELNLATPLVQSSFYQLIQDKRVGDVTLPEGYFMLAAGNRIEDRANIFELAAPLANRIAHIELAKPTSDAWIEWASKNHIDPRVLAFIQQKPSFLFKFEKTESDKAFPTPRTWQMCSKLIKGVETKDLKFLDILVSSAVGEAAAGPMLAFLKFAQKLRLQDYLEDPKRVKTLGVDLTYSLVSELPFVYEKEKTMLPKVMKIMEHLQPEFAMLLIKTLKSVNTSYLMKEAKNYKFLTQYAKYM